MHGTFDPTAGSDPGDRVSEHGQGKGALTMALSDMLGELAQRAKEAEDRARAASAEAKDKVRVRVDEASDAARTKADELKQRSDASRNEASDHWRQVQADWAKHVEIAQSKFAAMKAEQDKAWSQMDADLAAADAEDAVRFALAAVEEAESATLDAILAQMEADEVASKG